MTSRLWRPLFLPSRPCHSVKNVLRRPADRAIIADLPEIKSPPRIQPSIVIGLFFFVGQRGTLFFRTDIAG
jgi:hypothetical protein